MAKTTAPRRALVTGGAGPLGSVIVQTLAGAGYEVIIHYHRSGQRARKLAREVGARTFQADLTDPRAARKLIQNSGRIDVLVHTVGDFIYQPLEKTSERAFTEVIESNLFSSWYLLKACLPGMRRRGFGRIVVFGTTGCGEITNRPLTTPYYIGKTSLLMLARSFAREERERGITVNMISPGVLPSGVRPHAAVPVIPFDAVARAVLFLAADDSRHITGANLEVNGGWRPE